MAKDMDLSKKKAVDPALMARVTGADKRKLPPPPVAAKKAVLPPGVTGTPPMPTDRIVGAIAPSSLTEHERASLEAIGWSDNVPLPSNSAQLVAELAARQTEEVLVPQIDPRAPRPKFEPVDVATLPPEKQNLLMGALHQAAIEEHAAKKAAQTAAQAGPKIPGGDEAMHAANQAAAYRHGQVVDDAIIDDRPQRQAAPPGGDPSPQLPPQVQPGDTGAAPHLTHCPQCLIDLSLPAIEPDWEEKMSFLHTLLGMKCFAKRYELMGGALMATFRTLTVKEMEVVYKQAYLDKQSGKAVNEADYWELVNRYRFFLQVQNVTSTLPGGFAYDLPDGLSKETNPDATGFWKVPVDDVGDGTALPIIEEFLHANVLKTVAMFKVLHVACNSFNRLAAKLEAMADNSDFWKPTDTPA